MADLHPEGYPLFAVFGNPQDPASIEVLKPTSRESLGAGIRIRRITVAITDEPVTRSLRARLSWLSAYPDTRVKQPIDPYDHSLKATLTHGDFVRQNK